MMKRLTTARLKQQTSQNLKRHLRLGKDLLNIRGPLVVGWLDRRYTECRKGNCKCTQGRKHGPFLYARLRLKDRNVYRYVGKPEDMPLVRCITRYAEFRKILARWRSLYRQLDQEWAHLERSLIERPKK